MHCQRQDPMRDARRYRLPDAWTVDEVQRIVEAAGRLDWIRAPIGPIPAGQWWRALLLVDYWTGLRVGALLGIRRSEIDLESAEIRIGQRGGPTPPEVPVRLGRDALSAVRAIWEPERELLFVTKRPPSMHRQFGLILDLAGVSAGKGRGRSQFEKWRQTAITHASMVPRSTHRFRNID